MPSAIGAPWRRVEDDRLLRGQGCYVGDLRLPGMLHAAFVRSPHAHARIVALDLEDARAMPGVVAALGPADLPALTRPLLPVIPDPALQTRTACPLASGVVRYVGEPVAVIVADDPYRLADAVAAAHVEYDPLPVVVDPDRARQEGSPLVHAAVPVNLAGHGRYSVGTIETAFDGAEIIVRDRFAFARAAGCALEPRGVVALPGAEGDGHADVDLTVWSSTQSPHFIQQAIAEAIGLSLDRVRVVAPDVGGGFGVKGRLHQEEIVVPALALHLRRPISWIATRQEDLISTCQGRGQVLEAELAARGDGTILGLRVRIIQDCGAYLPCGIAVPANTARHLLGPYRVPACAVELLAVYTHKVPVSPLRGGGRPQGVFAMERLLDHLARAIGRDPLEVRQRNLLQPGDFPYDTGLPLGAGTVVYDSGDYPAYLERARSLIDYDAVRRAQPEERRAGLYRGVAVTAFLESTGLATETARVEVDTRGAVRVLLGPPSQGQGHATSLAQVCAARLGVPPAQVQVLSGDTARGEGRSSTVASRTAAMAGNAVALAARAAREQALRAAADLLEVSQGDLELSEGIIAVRGVPGRTVTLAEVAQAVAAQGQGDALGATRTFSPERASYHSGGAHAAAVTVDLETGRVRIDRYVVVHDCGTVINPLIVEGQVHGGVAHGVGNALLEAIIHDEMGQILTTTLLDYAMPDAPQAPLVTIEHMESPSPFNPEGIKGAGEGGTIGALATVAGAVEDALAPFALTLNDLPLRPEDLLARLRATW